MGTNEKNMTAGSPGKLIITFAIPLMLGNIFQHPQKSAENISQSVSEKSFPQSGRINRLDHRAFRFLYRSTMEQGKRKI